MGSKSRIAKDIVSIIQKYLDDYKIDTYIEPFCGGCNVIDKIQCNTRIASDVNKYLIELLINRNQVSDLPEIVTKELYDECRKAYYGDDFSKYEQWYIAGIGFLQAIRADSMMVDLMGQVSWKENRRETITMKRKETF